MLITTRMIVMPDKRSGKLKYRALNSLCSPVRLNINEDVDIDRFVKVARFNSLSYYYYSVLTWIVKKFSPKIVSPTIGSTFIIQRSYFQQT